MYIRLMKLWMLVLLLAVCGCSSDTGAGKDEDNSSPATPQQTLTPTIIPIQADTQQAMPAPDSLMQAPMPGEQQPKHKPGAPPPPPLKPEKPHPRPKPQVVDFRK